MNEIIKKVRLTAAPTPSFVGTVIRIRTDDQNRTYGIYLVELAPGSDSLTIEWGDGSVERVGEVLEIAHTYEASGEYEVRLSDDINTLGASSTAGGIPFYEDYPRLVRSVKCNAERMKMLRIGCFARSSNLVSADFWGSKINTIVTQAFYGCSSLTSYCLPEELGQLGRGAFKGCSRLTGVHLPRNVSRLNADLFRDCTGLVGEVDVRNIMEIGGSGVTAPFSGCTGITLIHFGKANEDAIRSSSAYKADPTLGTGSAVCVFDL